MEDDNLLTCTQIPSIVHLDVGGKQFTVARTTLCKDRNSMLGRMFSGEVPLEQTTQGRYFIDRDPTHFRILLNYLRDGYCVLPEEQPKLEEMARECEFYQIDSLQSELIKVWYPNKMVAVLLKLSIIMRLAQESQRAALQIIETMLSNVFHNASISSKVAELYFSVSYNTRGVRSYYNNAGAVLKFVENAAVKCSCREAGAHAAEEFVQRMAVEYPTYRDPSDPQWKYDPERYRAEGFKGEIDWEASSQLGALSAQDERTLFQFHTSQQPLMERDALIKDFVERVWKNRDRVIAVLHSLFGGERVKSTTEAADRRSDNFPNYPTEIKWTSSVKWL